MLRSQRQVDVFTAFASGFAKAAGVAEELVTVTSMEENGEDITFAGRRLSDVDLIVVYRVAEAEHSSTLAESDFTRRLSGFTKASIKTDLGHDVEMTASVLNPGADVGTPAASDAAPSANGIAEVPFTTTTTTTVAAESSEWGLGGLIILTGCCCWAGSASLMGLYFLLFGRNARREITVSERTVSVVPNPRGPPRIGADGIPIANSTRESEALGMR